METTEYNNEDLDLGIEKVEAYKVRGTVVSDIRQARKTAKWANIKSNVESFCLTRLVGDLKLSVELSSEIKQSIYNNWHELTCGTDVDLGDINTEDRP